jgi:hypothetical protein
MESLMLYMDGFSVEFGTNFTREVVEDPEVVIACKQVYFYSLIAEFSQFANGSCKASWDGPFVLKPEVEKIADNVKCFQLRSNLFEPRNELLLTN